MTDKASYTLEELATLTSSELVGNPNHIISGVENLEAALENQISFLANPLYLKMLKRSKAGAVFVTQLPAEVSEKNYLVTSNPSRAFQIIIELFFSKERFESGFSNIHPTAVIHPTAEIGDEVHIGPYAVIDQHVKIGARTTIKSHVNIGPYVEIGTDCFFHPQVTVRENCEIHNSVILQSGCVIGSCGFGYITDARGVHHKLRHVGKVVLEDDVEIGSNTCLDRARFKETRIKKGAKIDNLVQIAHGVQVGEYSIIISQAGIAGSANLGKYNVIAGQVGIVGHISLADHVTIAARGAVTKSLSKPGRYGGAPAIPEDKFYSQQMHFRKLDAYVKKIRDFEQKFEEIQEIKDKFLSEV